MRFLESTDDMMRDVLRYTDDVLRDVLTYAEVLRDAFLEMKS